MPNVGAEFTASIVIDKNDLITEALKQLSTVQKELENNKLEIYFDFSNQDLQKKLKEYQKQLSSTDYTIKISNDGIEETYKSLDKLLDVVKSIASGKAFGTGSGNGKGIGNSIIDENQLNKAIILFEKIETHLSSMRKVISDVGDGSEFSPLLTTINKIDQSITKLSSNFSGIGFNMNIDLGSDDELKSKIEAKTAGVLHAYEKLFNQIKTSGRLSQAEQGIVDNLNIGNFDGMEAKISEYERVIKELRAAQKSAYGKDYLRSDIDNQYWTAVSGAKQALSLAKKSESKNNVLKDMFGGTDLSEVISQLTTIASKLDSIVSVSQDLKYSFSQGLNVSTSVEEITKLTDRVKELEDELAKIKTPTTLPSNESNISSGKKDAFPSTDTKLDEAITSAKDLDKTLEQVDIPTDSFDKVLEKLDRTKSELVDIVKITRKSVSDKDGKFHDSYTLKDSRGSTEIYGMSSKTDKGQILDQNIVKYDAKKDSIDKSKEELEVQKQITAEIKAQSKANQKKWKDFQKEDQVYQKKQSEDEFIKRNQIAYKELTDTIKQYSEIAKRVSNGKAEDGDLKKMVQLEEKISQLQKQPILSESQVAKSENSLVSLYDQLDKIERKIQETNQKKVDTGFDKLSTYQGKADKYNATLDRFQDGGWTSDTYSKNVKAVRDAVKQYENLLNDIKAKGGIASEEDIQNLKEYENTVKKTIAAVENMSASEKGYSKLQGQKEIDKINQILKENSAMSQEAKNKIKAFKQELMSGNPSMSLEKIHGEIMAIVNAEEEAGRAGKSMWSKITDKVVFGYAAQLANYFLSFSDFIRYGQQMVSTVIDLNTKITELAKVSEQSSSQIYDDFNSYAKIAEDVRGTISDTISATADWSKNGYSIPDAKQLAEVSQLYKNVGDGIDINTADESLISTLKGFKLEADQAEHIVDVFNEVSNNESISSGGIGDALQRSAASFNAANTSLEKSVALVTATNSVLQDPEKVGKQNIAYLYSNVMKIKVAISVKLLRRTRPRKDYNIILIIESLETVILYMVTCKVSLLSYL